MLAYDNATQSVTITEEDSGEDITRFAFAINRLAQLGKKPTLYVETRDGLSGWVVIEYHAGLCGGYLETKEGRMLIDVEWERSELCSLTKSLQINIDRYTWEDALQSADRDLGFDSDSILEAAKNILKAAIDYRNGEIRADALTGIAVENDSIDKLDIDKLTYNEENN